MHEEGASDMVKLIPILTKSLRLGDIVFSSVISAACVAQGAYGGLGAELLIFD